MVSGKAAAIRGSAPSSCKRNGTGRPASGAGAKVSGPSWINWSGRWSSAKRRGVLGVEVRHLEQIETLVADVETELDGLAAADARTVLLRTIPGVAQRTAEIIVTTLDQVRRFKTGRQVASYAGLTPRRFQSGQMDRQGSISKRGNRLLRQVLNQAAWMTVRWNKHLRSVYLRISAGAATRRKLVIVAVMRKLLVTAWAMLRDARAYRPPRVLMAPVAA